MYQSQSKKNFLFILLAETGIVVVLYAYFLCVTKAYMTAKHPPKDDEDEKADDAATK
jgi:hypothetical protein